MTAVGILYAGELGAVMGSALLGAGLRVVTTVEDRSEATASRARSAGLELVASAEEVCLECDIVLSLVTPASALALAGRLAPHVQDLIYVDVNSVSPTTSKLIEETVEAAGASYVDAAFRGMASKLEAQGELYLAGKDADRVAAAFCDSIAIRRVWAEPGQASAMKMLLGGLSKSVVATWLELASAALELGLLEDFQEDSAHYYPAITALVERMEPTVRGAGLRRSEEMEQLQAMLKELGKSGVFAEHAKELFIACANIASEEEPDGERTSLTALVECYGLKNCSAEDS